jgi:hypothetical protein
MFPMHVSGTIYGNGGGSNFNDPPMEESSTFSIEHYVVKGAGFFLKSCSDLLLFLNYAEIAEIEGADFNALWLNLDNGISNMEVARDVFLQLKQKADLTPYNQSKIDELLKFNYVGFQKENNLLKPVFDQVKFYLGNGAVREFYGEILCQIDEILDISYIIKANIEVNEFPEVESLWNLQHRCCKSMLFGQYASRVFLKIQ